MGERGSEIEREREREREREKERGRKREREREKRHTQKKIFKGEDTQKCRNVQVKLI